MDEEETSTMDSTDLNASNGDLLSAALCAAGLDEFFAPLSSSCVYDQPTTSTTSMMTTTNTNDEQARTNHTPLPGITASASTSPDLPINAPSTSIVVSSGIGTTTMMTTTATPSVGGAKSIRVVRSDGKTVVIQLPKASPQGPVRIPIGAVAAAPRPMANPSTMPSGSVGVRPIVIRPPQPSVLRAASPSIGLVRTPAPISPPGLHRTHPSSPTLLSPTPNSGLSTLSSPTQGPFMLGRTRLLPAKVQSTFIRHPPSILSRPALPPPSPATQLQQQQPISPQRSRVINYNPNSSINGVDRMPNMMHPPLRPASTSSSSASSSASPQIRQRFAPDHERAAGIYGDLSSASPSSSVYSLVGPMRPLTATAIPQRRIPSTPTFAYPEPRPKAPYKHSNPNAGVPVVVDEEEDEEELGFAETYAEYKPAKLRTGFSHPDQVVETSSLSSVLPPDVIYQVSIPDDVVDTRKLSALQMEAVVYACQKTETFMPGGERAGYLIGDGPGVGKGRTIAAFIYENYLLGRKRALWFSVSSDLKYDSERDLRDIGAGRIKVFSLNKFKYAKISGKENGSVKKGVIFATYSSLIGESNSAKSKYRSRLKQLQQWCGKDFEGVVVFDECHRAKNLVPTGTTKPTKTGQAVLELQKLLPKARVLYASATGATETRNMAYMTRLGLWGIGKPFKDFGEFIAAVEKRGVGAMEIVAMDMKLRGIYIARQLSFAGVTFRIEEIPLSEDFIRMYDESVKLWLEAKKHFRMASELVGSERTHKKAMWSQFWAAHQRFFKYLCIAAKVRECVRLTTESLKNGKCVVMGLQSTGESRTLDQLEETGGELTDFVSTAKGVFQSLIEKHFPSIDDSGAGRASRRIQQAEEDNFPLFGDEDDDDWLGNTKNKKGQWKRKLVTEHRERRKRARKDKAQNDEESPSSSSSSDEEKNSENDEDEKASVKSDFNSDAESSSSAASDDDEEDNEGSQSDTDTGDDTADKFNPFADDTEEADPWESKIIDKNAKKKKKRRKVNLEHDQELQRQLEQAMQADSDDEVIKPEPKPERVIQSVSANDFLSKTSSYIDRSFKPGRFASELGLDKPQVMKVELLAAVERLGDTLPANTLDQLIDELGGPNQVAEMTGRKGRVVSKDDGEIQYELRNDDYDVPLELMNVAEREKFMNGDKLVAIISEAASSGISLQSDRRAQNQRRRVHITLELPWSADKAVQQFGRTHRSNQVSAPEYVFMISELAGEQRFASIVAKRLESLGALTHGDRRATESRDLSQFNLDTKYGRAALEITLKSIIKMAKPIVTPPTEYKGDFFGDMCIFLEGVGILFRDDPTGKSEKRSFSIEKDANMAKFLNRLLGLPVMAQNSLFQYFSDTLREVVDQAKRDCRFDLGIMDLGHGGEKVKKVQTHVFVGKMETGSLKSELHTVIVERGIAWEGAVEIFQSHTRPNDGFYMLNNSSPISPTVILICDAGKKRLDNGERQYHIYRPNIGLSTKLETFPEIKKRFRKVTPEEAEPAWKKHFDVSSRMCQHEYWFGRCRANEIPGSSCDVGRRKRTYHIVSGSVLAVWNTVEQVLGSLSGRRQTRMQIVRVRTDTEHKIVGILIPLACKKALIDRLTEESFRTYTESFE